MKRILLSLIAIVCLSTPASAQIQGQVTQNAPSTSNELNAENILHRLLSANNIAPDRVQHIQIMKADELNAATDGKDIIFSSALWNLLRTDDQRAFVIGHELSHIVLNHVPKTQGRRIGLILLSRWLTRDANAETGVRSQLVQAATAAGLSLVDNKFSRNMELSADDNGLRIMTKAGYKAPAALEVFNLMEQASPNATPEFLQSHPLSKSRIQALVKKYPNVR